jgi:putative membrane protein
VTVHARTAPDLPREWARLHVLSPLLRFARALTAFVVVLLPNAIAMRDRQRPYIDLALVLVALGAGVVSWLVTRWRISDGELQIETGLVRRQSLRVPLTRLQAVDVVRPLLGRMLGLAEVRLVVAGQGSGRTRLAYLPDARAEEVRAQLLALAHGLKAETPTPAERPALRVPRGRLIGAHVLTRTGLSAGLLFLGLITLTAVAPRDGLPALTGLVPLLFGLGLEITRRIGSEWDFAIAEASDGLRLRAGMLQTRAETIPYGRAQALRWVQPLWWRPFGWVRLEIDVARRRDRDQAERESGGTTRALLPVGSAAEAEWLVDRIFARASLVPPPTSRAPRRARWRAPILWHNLDAWRDGRYVVCAGGRLVRSVVVVPLDKAQSIRWSQGPLSRRLRLANVHVHTAGRRFPAAARLRDEQEAAVWISELPDLAQSFRATAPTR